MENSLLAIIPTAAIVGAVASVGTTIWRETAVQRRQDERVRFELEWKFKADRFERLLAIRKELPRLGFPSKREEGGRPVLDVAALQDLTQEFIRFTDLEVKPLLAADKRSRIEGVQRKVEIWLNEMAQAFHGKSVQPEVPATEISNLYKAVNESIIGEIDLLYVQVGRLRDAGATARRKNKGPK